MIKEIKGDLLGTSCAVIAHGVNCRGQMGSGVAKVISDFWPEVKNGYLESYKEMKDNGYKDEDFLGLIGYIEVPNEKTILNCYTQLDYGYDRKLYLNYTALADCFRGILNYCDKRKIRQIAIPKIGCGLAGGDWEKVKFMIEEIVQDKLEVLVYIKDNRK